MMPRVATSRFEVLAAAVVVFVLVAIFVRDARGDDVPVPVGLQAELLAKVAGYDKNLPSRAGDRVRILIVDKGGNSESESAAAHMQSALAELGPIAGLPHDESVVAYSSASALVAQIRASRVAIVYFAPGLVGALDAIVGALDGVDVLSAGAVPEYVPRGIVLGFDVVSGKPKLLVNLTHARKQNVAFKSEVLKIMRVYE